MMADDLPIPNVDDHDIYAPNQDAFDYTGPAMKEKHDKILGLILKNRRQILAPSLPLSASRCGKPDLRKRLAHKIITKIKLARISYFRISCSRGVLESEPMR